MNSRSRSRSSDMSVNRPTKFNDKQQSHLNKIEELKSKNSQESMIISKSDSSENINIDSDESEQSNFSQNSQEEAKDVSVNSDDSESPKTNVKVTQKAIRNINLSNFTSRVSEKEIQEKDNKTISFNSILNWDQKMEPTIEKKDCNEEKVNKDFISLSKKRIKRIILKQ